MWPLWRQHFQISRENFSRDCRRNEETIVLNFANDVLLDKICFALFKLISFSLDQTPSFIFRNYHTQQMKTARQILD